MSTYVRRLHAHHRYRHHRVVRHRLHYCVMHRRRHRVKLRREARWHVMQPHCREPNRRHSCELLRPPCE